MNSLFSRSGGEMGGVLGSWIGAATGSGAPRRTRPQEQSCEREGKSQLPRYVDDEE